jgi:hypothetical protein
MVALQGGRKAAKLEFGYRALRSRRDLRIDRILMNYLTEPLNFTSFCQSSSLKQSKDIELSLDCPRRSITFRHFDLQRPVEHTSQV